MNGMHGIIFSYEKSNGLRELTEHRIHGSVPFGGSYRMVDFILSDMVNAGIRDVGVIMHGQCQSMMDHLRSGKSWDLSRSFGGLTLLPVFAYNSARGNGRFRGKLEALDVVKDYLRHIRQDYVVLADSDVALNIDLQEVLQAHIATGADITAVCAPSTEDGLYLNMDGSGRVREVVEQQREGFRCLQIFLLRTDLLLSLVERFVSRNEYSFQEYVIQGLTEELHIHGYIFHGFAAHITDVAGYYESSMQLLDRFGDPPKAVTALLDVALLRADAAAVGICDISQKGQQLLFRFTDRVDPPSLLAVCSMASYKGRLLLHSGSQPYLTLYLKEKENSLQAAAALTEQLRLKREQ